MPKYNCIQTLLPPSIAQPCGGFIPCESTYQDSPYTNFPYLIPGSVYTVNYTEMFTWTRQSHTNAAYGPTAHCEDTTKMQDWHYTCQDAEAKTGKMQSGQNYMFVVGPINQCPSCMLLFFFNSCKTLDMPYRSCLPKNADGSLPQGIYLPAIYDRNTGTIFSETFETTLSRGHRHANQLTWHIYGRAQTIGATECCTRLTMSRSKVYAHLCDTTTAQALQTTLLSNILHRFHSKDGNFKKWVAAHFSIPVSDPHQIKTVFVDEARPSQLSQPGTDPCSNGYTSTTFAPCSTFTGCTTPCEDEPTTQSNDCFYPFIASVPSASL